MRADCSPHIVINTGSNTHSECISERRPSFDRDTKRRTDRLPRKVDSLPPQSPSKLCLPLPSALVLPLPRSLCVCLPLSFFSLSVFLSFLCNFSPSLSICLPFFLSFSHLLFISNLNLWHAVDLNSSIAKACCTRLTISVFQFACFYAHFEFVH